MKQYRLTAWPELPSIYGKTAFRRILSDMSHRYISLSQLAHSAGIPQQEIKSFLEMLTAQGSIKVRDWDDESDLTTSSIERTKNWIRRVCKAGH